MEKYSSVVIQYQQYQVLKRYRKNSSEDYLLMKLSEVRSEHVNRTVNISTSKTSNWFV